MDGRPPDRKLEETQEIDMRGELDGPRYRADLAADNADDTDNVVPIWPVMP